MNVKITHTYIFLQLYFVCRLVWEILLSFHKWKVKPICKHILLRAWSSFTVIVSKSMEAKEGHERISHVYTIETRMSQRKSFTVKNTLTVSQYYYFFGSASSSVHKYTHNCTNTKPINFNCAKKIKYFIAF